MNYFLQRLVWCKVENINISLLELFNAFAADELDELHQPSDEDEYGGGKLLNVQFVLDQIFEKTWLCRIFPQHFPCVLLQ